MTEGHESKGNTVKKYLFILFAMFVTPTWAASFDCAKAGTPTEKTICSDSGLSKLDETLLNNYKSVMAAFKEAGFGGEEDLKKEQKVWNKDKDSCGASVSCLTMLYAQRVNELCDMAIAPGVFPQNCITVDANPATIIPSAPAVAPESSPVTQVEPTPVAQQSDVVPFEVKTSGNSIFITSLEDGLLVDSISPNRGNCRVIDFVASRKQPVRFTGGQVVNSERDRRLMLVGSTGSIYYGEILTATTNTDCAIRELSITTNKGSWTMSIR